MIGLLAICRLQPSAEMGSSIARVQRYCPSSSRQTYMDAVLMSAVASTEVATGNRRGM
jgi:hypothetical protein